MRADSQVFADKNLAPSKDPRYVVQIAFDSANTRLKYFTSHADAATPGGATVVAGVVEKISGTSQKIDPDQSLASIGTISFDLVDKASAVTDAINDELVFGYSTRQQRMRVYVGYQGMAWTDYVIVATQLIESVSFKDGAYTFRCADIQRQMRKDIFDPAKTNLSQALGEADTTVQCYDTSTFTLVAHGASYSDAPSATVGYIRIGNEVIRYTGKTATTFTGCTRGALNTSAVAHTVNATDASDRRPQIEEYIYLEMPAVKLIYALMTGVLYGQGGATLPANWHLGIDSVYVNLTEYTGIGLDLWNTANDNAGFVPRFDGVAKIDGKQFIERELLMLIGCFAPIYSDGTLGIRRMTGVLSGAAYVAQLDEKNTVSHADLQHDFKSLHNQIQIDWNYNPFEKRYTRTTLLIDGDSITVHGRAETLKLKFAGLNSSRHSNEVLFQRFDALRDRYAGPPLRLSAQVLPSLNTLEVGDVVRVRLPTLRDFITGSTVDRSFEVQQVGIDWISGKVNLQLFGSTRAASPIISSSAATVLTDAWYVGAGTALSTVLTITGSNPGHVSANGTITGGANLTTAVFYYDGDLVIDAGVNVNITGNVQLRVKGHLTINGTINGNGAGLSGAVAPAANCTDVTEPYDACEPYWDDYVAGTPGFLGATISGGGITVGSTFQQRLAASYPGYNVVGLNDATPGLVLGWDGTTLEGIPVDLRGTSGSSGHVSIFRSRKSATAGNGGASGAGLMVVCRGASFGAAGNIDVSGADGVAGSSFSGVDVGKVYYSGSGAGGAPGAIYFILDGLYSSAPTINAQTIVAQQGITPIPAGATVLTGPSLVTTADANYYSYYTGPAGTTDNPVPDLSGSPACRVQYVPGGSASGENPADQTLVAPSSVSLSSGTSELFVSGDGTIIVRIKATWSATPDRRAVGYDIQYKESSSSLWQSAASVIGVGNTTTWIAAVMDGIDYDVRVRAADGLRHASAWVTVTNHTAIGKTAPPGDVSGLTATDTFLRWNASTEPDRKGYVVRYRTDGASTWETATPAHGLAYLTDAQFDTRDLVGGLVKMLVKAIDTSDNLSTNATALDMDLRPAAPTQFSVTRQADGTRQFEFGLVPAASDHNGFVIRYYLGSTSDWGAMSPLHTGVQKVSPFETNQLAAGTYTFACKAVDVAGNESQNATFITTVTIGDPRISGAFEDVNETTESWSGTKTSCHVDTTTLWLVADGTGTWTSLPSTWAGWTEWNHSPASPIEYLRQIDVGLITTFTPLVTVVADGTQTITEAHSSDDISYTSYAAIAGPITARYVRIKVSVSGSYPKMKSMRTLLIGNSETDYINDQNSASLTGSYRIGTGDVRIPLSKTFSIIKKVGVSLQNVGAGWSWELIDKTTTYGPRIKIYNASNTLADAVFDADVDGIQ